MSARYPLHGHYFGRSVHGTVRPDEILTARTRYLLAGHAKLHETATTGRTAYMSGDTGRVHGPRDTRAFRAGDIVTDVQSGESGTVLRDFGNGIVRVQWHERKRRDGRRLVPLVTDIGAVRLCA